MRVLFSQHLQFPAVHICILNRQINLQPLMAGPFCLEEARQNRCHNGLPRVLRGQPTRDALRMSVPVLIKHPCAKVRAVRGGQRAPEGTPSMATTRNVLLNSRQQSQTAKVFLQQAETAGTHRRHLSEIIP